MPKTSARALWAARLKDGKLGKEKSSLSSAAVSMTPFRGIILGIDPSLRGTGLALLKFDPPASPLYILSETVVTPAGSGLPQSLGLIAAAVNRLLDSFNPVAVAIEETIYVQNFQTAQKLGAARGAAIGQAAIRGLPVFEYSPLRIKQSVVGYGRASKEQVSGQMSGLLGLKRKLPFDESDAAAVAYCHAITAGRGLQLK